MKKFKRILLIDDNDADNFMHALILKKLDCFEEIVAKLDGVKALEYLSTKEDEEYPKPDFILLDINMPRMNGWEFIEEYKKLDDDVKGGPILMMLSTSLNPEDVERANQDSTINSFMNKPLNAEAMKEAIAQHHPDFFD